MAKTTHRILFVEVLRGENWNQDDMFGHVAPGDEQPSEAAFIAYAKETAERLRVATRVVRRTVVYEDVPLYRVDYRPQFTVTEYDHAGWRGRSGGEPIMRRSLSGSTAGRRKRREHERTVGTQQ